MQAPSVLESRTLRLFAGRERKGQRNAKSSWTGVVTDWTSRLDLRVFVEVDGFAYHWTPEQKRYDDKRRNELRLLGYEILVYDWKAVMDEPRRVVKETKTETGNTPRPGTGPDRQKKTKPLPARPPRRRTTSSRD